MYILQMVNGVPTRQIFRPVENSHVFFFCMCCRRREPFLHVVLALQQVCRRCGRKSPPGRLGLSRPGTVLPRGRLGLPPSDDSLVGPLARHLAGFRLQSCLLTGNCCRPQVSRVQVNWVGLLGRPKVASALLALPGSKALFYFWDQSLKFTSHYPFLS